MSLHELLRCEDHHQEVRVFSHLNFLLEESENIPRLVEAEVLAAHTEKVQQESMVEEDIVQVEDIGNFVDLEQRQVPEAGHELHTTVVVDLCLHHLVHKRQTQERR